MTPPTAPRPRARWRGHLQLALGAVLGAALLWLVFRGVDGRAFAAAVRGVRPGVWLAVLAVSSLMHLVRCWRWSLIVRTVRPVPFRDVLSIASVGLVAIQVLPLRLGELLRPYLLLERRQVPFGAAASSVVVERTADILSLGAAFYAAVLWADLPLERLTVGGLDVSFVADGRRAIALALVPFAGCLLLFAVAGEAAIRPLVAGIGRVHGGLGRAVGGFVRSFREGVRALRDLRFAAALLGLSVVAWALNAGVFWLLAEAFGLDLPPMAGLVLLVVFMVGMLLPAPPLFAGVFEAFVLAGLTLYGVEHSGAAAYAVVCHGTQMLVMLGWGLPFLWLDGLSVRAFLRFARGLAQGEPR